LEFIFTRSSIGIIALRKGLLGDEMIRRNSSLRLVLQKNRARKIEQIQKNFITYNLKIKENTTLRAWV